MFIGCRRRSRATFLKREFLARIAEDTSVEFIPILRFYFKLEAPTSLALRRLSHELPIPQNQVLEATPIACHRERFVLW